MEKTISKFKQYKILQLFTLSLRYLLGASFVYASIFKIKGIRFMPEPSENTPINTLPHFFETLYQAGHYWHFIGWGQLIVGFLLISHIFSTLGAVAFLPIMLNILVITISFQSTNILIITSFMVLANVYLLLWDWHKLKFIIMPQAHNYFDNEPLFLKQKTWTYLGFLLFLFILLFRIITTKNMD